MPSVVEARALNEIDRERKAEQRAQGEADFIAARIEQADAFAGKQELRQTVRAAEHAVHATFEAPVAAADHVLDSAGRAAGGLAKIIVDAIGGLFNFLVSGPKLTPQQAHEKAQARDNIETIHAHDVAAAMRANEAEFDDRMHAQKTSQQEQDLSFAARFGTPPTREANIGREHDQSREARARTRLAPADGFSAGPTKHRTIIGAIKELFREAAKASTRAPDEPQPKARKRRRSGEDTRDPFPAAARLFARRGVTQPYAAAHAFLSNTIDWLNLWHHDTATTSNPGGSGFDTVSNPLSPHL